MPHQLAIMDWGIGGLGVYRAVMRRLGAAPSLYFSDAGAAPYGAMSRRELSARLGCVIEVLGARGVTHLVVGCNAASTVLPDLNAGEMTIIGVIESALDLAEQSRPASLAVIGGARTIASGIYRRELARRGISVRQRVAQPLSALIESGDVSSATLHQTARKILAPVRDVSHILLACTHYPAITPVLKQCVAPATVFLDPAAALAEEIARWNLPLVRESETVFLTTGEPEQMKRAAVRAFGVNIEAAEPIKI